MYIFSGNNHLLSLVSKITLPPLGLDVMDIVRNIIHETVSQATALSIRDYMASSTMREMLQNILVEEAEKASRADSGSRGSPTGATSGRIASSRLLLTTTQHSAAGSPPLPTPSTPASSRPTDASAVSPAGHQTRIFLLVEGVGDGHVANKSSCRSIPPLSS
uniref:Uncharacterized protein n=1 Tax=Chromera velia CCMP2878 TaxID=1169474 RepID=A0A0G4HPG5_9ALVE|eukprot:Cvel_29860.t1-p1 / transcript=Cvel_29860.t1 / gene=Cvel_29860 / organism=Chromera_velia_CCMP2878 / gene_product=hypothetical protein / transcript_product=hypothetical protein / location=Cvel_scaffold4166:4868-6372(-) / protein_length=161 / sequence_SO=supercontig / SO=protein_coding / is_pseudo=false